MPEKKRRTAAQPVRIETRTKEILVARSRSVEPYLHQFSVLPENITQEPLGRLVGVFSVSDHSDSSAYIGNVITSVAKKEYYANTRRGAIESFEAALHRTNLALSELVKNGETRFMGHLHGVIAAIEHGNIHFSVTGEARILLFRDDAFMDIGEGLASEDAATHPMKTFVEISSGRLLPGDCLVITSPELLSLFSLEDLSTNARRLTPHGKFQAFLETAMVNDLRAGTALVIEAFEAPKALETKRKNDTQQRPRKSKEKAVKRNTNYFSERTFQEIEEKRASLILEEPSNPEPEETKSQTHPGTIYIEGETLPEKEEHPWLTTLRWRSEAVFDEVGKWSKRNRNAALSGSREAVSAISRSAKDTCRSATRSLTRMFGSFAGKIYPPKDRSVTSQPKRHTMTPKSGIGRGAEVRHEESDTESTNVSEENPILARALALSQNKKTKHKTSRKREPARSVTSAKKNAQESVFRFLKQVSCRLRPLGQALLKGIREGTRVVVSITSRLLQTASRRFFALPKKYQLIGIAGAAFLLTFAGMGVWKILERNSEPVSDPPVIVIEEPEPAFPPDDEPNAVIAALETITSEQSNIIAPVFLDDTLFMVTKDGVIAAEDNDFFALPSDTLIRSAAGMDDLALIFLLTEDGDLYAFAPLNGSFTKNDIETPNGFRPAGMGTFLTYLYLFDNSSRNIYRYPRAEGGFGEGTAWTASPLDVDMDSLAINGAVYVLSDSGVVSLFRGKPTENFSFESPATPLTPTALCAHEEVPERFAILDAPAKRVLLYEDTGTLIRQYFHESFEGMTACSLSDSGTEIAVSSSETIFTFSLEE
jgi:hypothetical protein